MFFLSRFSCPVSLFVSFLCLLVFGGSFGLSAHISPENRQIVKLENFFPVPAGPDTLTGIQISDSLYLDEIIIRSTRIRESLRFQPVDVQLIDSLRLSVYRSMPVSAVLSRYSSLFIRDNGPGGVATLSQRGLSPGQTQVLWEGMPINSLSLGLADLSVIPAGLFGSVEVSPGTPSSAFGGGSLGGTVYLSSRQTHRQNHVEFIQSAGAFETLNSQFRASYETGNLSGSVQAIYHTAENDFSYYNRATGRTENRAHNAGRSGHLTGNIHYQGRQSRIYSSFWYFNARDEIPGSILSGSSQADQSNSGLRWLGGIEIPASGWIIDIRTFLERDHFRYVDPPTDIDSRFTRDRWLTNIDFRQAASGRLIWQGGFSGGLERVDTNNYAGEPLRRLAGLRLNPEIRIRDQKLRLTPAARADIYTGYGWVLSPSFGANWELFENHLYLRGLVSRDFNPPSFNDLYWVPGGNADLVPERSFKTEAGLLYYPQVDIFNSFSFTGYRIWLENGIYWFPDSEGTWTPSNIEEVDAYGLEARLNAGWQVKSADLLWTLSADWRKSEIAMQRFPGDQAAGRQMRYVPEWSFRSDFSIRVALAVLHANYRWTGRRFITSDHTSSLDEFQILDISAVVEQGFWGADWHLRISVNNLLNEQYEIIQWYPMPGRHLQFSIGMKLPV